MSYQESENKLRLTRKDAVMTSIDLDTLNQFTGTDRYYLFSRRHLLTDGTRYLAEIV